MLHLCIIKQVSVKVMEEYIRDILNRLSFDRELFLKELLKSRRWLTQDECDLLDTWVLENHKDIVGDGHGLAIAG